MCVCTHSACVWERQRYEVSIHYTITSENYQIKIVKPSDTGAAS